MAPVLWLGAVTLVLTSGSFMFDVPGDDGDAVEAVLDVSALIGFAGLPYAYLAGLARTRSWRAGAIGDVLAALGEAPRRDRLRDALREALREALGDPSLRIAFWLPERGAYVDAEGRPLALPAPGDPDRVAVEVEREGRRVGALVQSRRLAEDDPELVRAVASAAALALDAERLEAELRARVEELRESRQRVVDAALRERRRLERDLHDGAQQRLVALSLQLGLVESALRRDPAAARELLDGARAEARAALDDLRELRAASIPRSSPTAGWPRRSRRSPTARRCRSR
jgi:signal transduction histidine kinase